MRKMLKYRRSEFRFGGKIMTNEFSKVVLNVRSFQLERRSHTTGHVLDSNQEGVNINDKVIVLGALASLIFESTKHLPWEVLATVVLEQNPQPNKIPWQVKSIESIDSVFLETSIDRLVVLQRKSYTPSQYEFNQMYIDLLEDGFEFPSRLDAKTEEESAKWQKTGEELEIRHNRIITRRRNVFNAIIESTLNPESIMKVAKALDVKLTDSSSANPITLLRAIQGKHLRVSDQELAKLEGETGVSFIRNQSEAERIVIEKCREILRQRHSVLVTALEEYLHISTKMRQIESQIESSPVLNPTASTTRKLIGVINRVPSYG